MLANQLLKLRRKKKQEADQQHQQQMVQAQAQANAEAAEKAAMAEVQKNQAMAETTMQIEQGKGQIIIQKIQTEAEIEKQLMEIKFGYDKQLKQMDLEQAQAKEKSIENRKDNRTRMQASQQSELIDQRRNNSLPINFETSPIDQQPGGGGEAPMMGGDPMQNNQIQETEVTEQINTQ